MAKQYFKALNSTGTMVEVPLGKKGAYTLFSYGVPVAVRCVDKSCFITTEKHSKTTSKHIRQWERLPSDGAYIGVVPQAAIEALAEGRVVEFKTLGCVECEVNV